MSTSRERVLLGITGVGITASLLLGFAVAVAPSSAALTPAQVAQAALDAKENAIAGTVLATLNAERRANHLPSLVMNVKLIYSAHAHNVTMAKYNQMSHRLPGEAFFADRISHFGYAWRSAGENIGWNSDRTKAGAVYLETLMYNERPPADGHRRNILSRTFRNVGIDIYIDARTHKLWLTEDFGTPR